MFTQTTILAIRVTLCLALRGGDNTPVSHQVLAQHLGASESYLSKVITHLTKQGILNTQRGPSGGASLARAPEDITLLDVVHACEGNAVMALHPDPSVSPKQLCPLHRAMIELEALVSDVLGRWTIADLRVKTGAAEASCSSRTPCFMRQVSEAAQALSKEAARE